MDDRAIVDWQRRLRSDQGQDAWDDFLREFAPLLLHVAQSLECDPGRAADCFVFICEKLSEKNFHRLQKFSVGGRALFSTWLKAVARNLCLDWHRREYGRCRPLRVVSTLSPREQAVFELVFQRGCSEDEALLRLLPQFPSLDRQAIDTIVKAIGRMLSPRQHWLIGLRRQARAAPLVGPLDDQEGDPVPIADNRPDPEEAFAQVETRAALRRAAACLRTEDRLVLRLRFEEGLALDQVARVAGLGNAQAADRRIREILRRLRERLAGST